MPRKQAVTRRARFPGLPANTLYVTIDAGASHMQVTTRTAGDTWVPTDFNKNCGQTRGAFVSIPTIAAINKDRKLFNGVEAHNALISKPGFHALAYLKLALVDPEKLTKITRELIGQQRKEALKLGLKIEDVAVGFFSHVLKFLDVERWKKMVVYVNISDAWKSDVAQSLNQALKAMIPDGIASEIHLVGECLATMIGCDISGGTTVSFDIGDSTMNCSITTSDGMMRDTKEPPLGAGMINQAIEKMACDMGKTDDLPMLRDYIDTHVKPDTSIETKRFGAFTKEEWAKIQRECREAEMELIKAQQSAMKSFMRLVPEPHEPITVTLSGGGARGKISQQEMEEFFRLEFPQIVLQRHDDIVSLVTTGLQRIADKPDLREVRRAPVSMYLKSGEEKVVRVYRKGQSMSGKGHEPGDHHPKKFIVFDLETEAQGKPEIDLSVYCDQESDVPSKVQTKGIKATRKRKRGADAHSLMHSSLDKKTQLGHYTKDLSIKNPVPGKEYTVYVCAEMNRFGVKLFAVHAESGGKIPAIETGTVDAVIHNGQLIKSFEARVEEKVCLIVVAQVVRSETFGASGLGDFRHDPASISTTNQPTQDSDSVLVPRSPSQGGVDACVSLLQPKTESDRGSELADAGTAEYPLTVPESP